MIHQDLQTIFSVGEITEYIKQIFDNDESLQNVHIKGEISNLTRASSGHVYFTLKDKTSQMSCVMFRNYGFSANNFNFEQGDQVIVRGSFSVYVPQGKYQFYVREIQEAGIGMLYQQFLILKKKLEDEGLFNQDKKKSLPGIPEKIGVITSPSGAVIHDIIKTLKRKYPLVEVLLYPVMVQGEQAAGQIIEGLTFLNKKTDVDTIIIARGGGSYEDLWSFNDEMLARAVYNSDKPVISAIGHETDFTILDFIADYRAATPTAAAEAAVPDIAILLNELNENKKNHLKHINEQITNLKIELDDFLFEMQNIVSRQIKSAKKELYFYAGISGSFTLREKLKYIHIQLIESIIKKQSGLKMRLQINKLRILQSLNSKVKSTHIRLNSGMKEKIKQKQELLRSEKEKINMLDINSTLKRGFTKSIKGGKVISSVKEIAVNDELTTIFKDGKVISKVKKTNTNHDKEKERF